MTIDERIEQLTAASESHQKSLDKQQKTLDKLSELLVGALDAIKRLERIAGVLLITDEELDQRLTALEQRGPRKPQ